MSDSGGPLGFDPDEEPRPAPAPVATPDIDDPVGLRGGGRSRIPLGIALLAGAVLLAWVGLNTAGNTGVPSTGPAPGSVAPPFAAPLALSRETGDVNVARRADQGAAGHVPACTVRGAGILNSCDLMRGHPVALAFFTPGQQRCVKALAALEEVRRVHPEVRFAAIALGGDRDRVRSEVRKLRLGYPVAYDRDSVLANLYGVAVCPLVTFVNPGGRVSGTAVGEQPAGALERRVRALEAGRGATGP